MATETHRSIASLLPPFLPQAAHHAADRIRAIKMEAVNPVASHEWHYRAMSEVMLEGTNIGGEPFTHLGTSTEAEGGWVVGGRVCVCVCVCVSV